MKYSLGTASAVAMLSLICAPPAWATQTVAPKSTMMQERVGPSAATSEFPKFERFRLPNGIEVWFVERHEERSLSMQMVVRTGVDRDFRSRLPGTQSLVVALLKDGTQTRSREVIARELQALSGNILVGGDNTSVSIRLEAPSANAVPMINLWSDLIKSPNFPSNEFNAKRDDYLRYIRDAAFAEPYQTSTATIERTFWGSGHPFARRATESSIARIAPKDLAEFHRRWFGANNARIIVVGDTTSAALRNELEKAFGDWRTAPGKPVKVPASRKPQTPQVILIDHPGATRTFIRAGSFSPPSGLKQDFARGIFNSAFSLRLYKNLSDNKHLSDAFSAVPSGNSSRALIVTAPVKNTHVREAVAEIRREILRIRTEPLGEVEVAAAQSEWSKPYLERWKSGAAIFDGLDSIPRYGLPPDYWDRYLDRIGDLSVREVQAAGDKILLNDDLVWVISGDLSQIERDVRSLNLGEVEIQTPEGRRVR